MEFIRVHIADKREEWYSDHPGSEDGKEYKYEEPDVYPFRYIFVYIFVSQHEHEVINRFYEKQRPNTYSKVNDECMMP